MVYTKSRQEKKVYEELTLQKYISYLPLVDHLSTWSDRQKLIKKPLFPSYVFVYLKNISNYYKVLQIKGVVTFIRFEGKFAIVKESEIEQIKRVIENCSKIELLQSDIKIGEKRKILSGPLSGIECVVIDNKRKNKIIVNINALNQVLIAEVNASNLYF